MSDWTPPSPQPQEPLPPRGPVPFSPQAQHPYPSDGGPHDEPPRKRRRKRPGRVLGLVGGGSVLVLVLVVLAGTLIGRASRADHTVGTPAVAGGLNRDPAAESRMSDQLKTIESQFHSTVPMKERQLVTAVYTKPRDDDAGPAGPIVVVAAAFSESSNPDDFVAGFRRSVALRSGFKVVDVDAGKGAKGVCAESTTSLKISQCAWSTNDSFGELLPAGGGWDAERLAALLRKVRPDVEKTLD